MTIPALPLANLSARHTGVTQPIGDGFYEAASVCLERHHRSPKQITISDPGGDLRADVEWGPVTETMQKGWANEIDATEAGAYGCVLAAIELVSGMVAVRRAEAGSGADYYVGPPGAGDEDLETCLRLEVSGLDRGDPTNIRARLASKILQANSASSNIPAIAGVVGFLELMVLIAEVPDSS